MAFRACLGEWEKPSGQGATMRDLGRGPFERDESRMGRRTSSPPPRGVIKEIDPPISSRLLCILEKKFWTLD